MPTNEIILNELDSQLLKDVEKLAGGNMAPSDIALKLDINKSAFMRIWREKGSSIRDAYERGRLSLDVYKAKKLKSQIKAGNVTAIQIHDNKADVSYFEAKKKEIFGLE